AHAQFPSRFAGRAPADTSSSMVSRSTSAAAKQQASLSYSPPFIALPGTLLCKNGLLIPVPELANPDLKRNPWLITEQPRRFGDVGRSGGNVSVRHRRWPQAGSSSREIFDQAYEIGQQHRLPAAEIDDFIAEGSIRGGEHALDDVRD